MHFKRLVWWCAGWTESDEVCGDLGTSLMSMKRVRRLNIKDILKEESNFIIKINKGKR